MTVYCEECGEILEFIDNDVELIVKPCKKCTKL